MKYIIPAIAITSITILESIALIKGINGTFLLGALTLVSGIGGYYAGKKKN